MKQNKDKNKEGLQDIGYVKERSIILFLFSSQHYLKMQEKIFGKE